MFITVDDFSVATLARAVPGAFSDDPPRKRSALEKFLWGSAPEFCDDCGIEVKASEAIRYPGGRTYCSVAHAIDDQTN